MYNETSRFYVVDKDYNEITRITGLYELARVVQPLIKQKVVGECFKTFDVLWGYDTYEIVYHDIDYVIYNEYDHIVPIHIINSVDVPERPCWWCRGERRGNFTFRSGPVPYTGNSRKWKHHNRSNISFMNEAKASYGREKYLRPKRGRGIIEIVYDLRWEDPVPRSAHFDKRSWKKVKKRKQWM